MLAVNPRLLGPCSDDHVPIHICGFAVCEKEAVEDDFGGEVGAGERLGGGDDEVEGVGASGGQPRLGPSGRLQRPDDPFGRLAHHFALLIQQQHGGAGRGHALTEMVLYLQRHDSFVASDLRR